MIRPQAGDYRRELDGVRAIAVLAVVFYHFDIAPFHGGFVGVDIFFVLSGFFIGSILWREVSDTGRVRYGRFLMRRIRRLAPAYFVMIAVVSVAAYFLLLPFEYRYFGKETIASVLYFSNIIYFRDAGYFDVASDSKVLLHTWSLSVEEQFYIFLPLLMLVLSRRLTWLISAVIVTFVASLIANLTVTPVSQTATFFLLPFRAWELLSGVLLAIAGHRFGLRWDVHPALSWAGIAILAASVVWIPAGESFPGALAIPPVLGTVLLILNGRSDTVVNRVLAMRGPVYVGLISYSLYLWHWPIVTLANYTSDGELSLLAKAALIGLSLVLASLSLRFVEAPVRRGKPADLPLLGGAAAASGLVLGAAALVYLNDGLANRFPPAVRTHIDASADFLQDFSRCRTPGDGVWAGVEICPIGPDAPPRILIWADSHGRAFKEGLEQLAFETGTPALLVWQGGCPPLFGIAKDESVATPVQDARCDAANTRLRAALDAMPELRRVLLIGRWNYYAEGGGVGRDIGNRVALSPLPGSGVSGETTAEIFTNAVQNSVELLSARFDDIHVLRQMPEMPWYWSGGLARNIVHGHIDDPDEILRRTTVSRSEAEARAATADAVLTSLAANGQIRLIDAWDAFCDDRLCSAVQDGRSGYFDNNHITNATARRLRDRFAPAFEGPFGDSGS